MPLYESKKVVMEAVQWTGRNFDEMKAFVGDNLLGHEDAALILKCPSGTNRACIGDYIATAGPDDFYPVPAKVFDARWQLA